MVSPLDSIAAVGAALGDIPEEQVEQKKATTRDGGLQPRGCEANNS